MTFIKRQNCMNGTSPVSQLREDQCCSMIRVAKVSYDPKSKNFYLGGKMENGFYNAVNSVMILQCAFIWLLICYC